MAIGGKKNDLISRVLRRAKEDIPFQAAPRDVETVLSFVHENLFDPDLNVDRLRMVCQLRNHNISTRFKGVVGIGIREYIEYQRIVAARRLLEHHELEVWRVATSVGFSSPESFCRSFRRREGTSPSAYRAKAGKPRAEDRLLPEPAGKKSRAFRDGKGDDPTQPTRPSLPSSLSRTVSDLERAKRA